MSRAPKRKESGPSLPATPEYCHPLTLQSLPPHRFQKKVRDILEGKLTILVRHGRLVKEQTI